MKRLLRGLAYMLWVAAGVSFLFGGVVMQALGDMEWLLAQVVGAGIAAVCLIAAATCRYYIDDIEWQEANEEAVASMSKIKP